MIVKWETLKFIGHIETPYEEIEACPNNIDFNGPPCQLIIKEEFAEGILGLQPGQNILILYWFENVERDLVQQGSKKGVDSGGALTGVFSLRSPHRPNPIGASILPIATINDGVISVNGLDCLNGTKLLDIKPAIMHENKI